MKSKFISSALAAAVLVLGAASIIWATVPPPPANQFLGIYDTKFGALTTREDCLACHVSDEVLVPRHHALINTKGMMCLDCHTMVPDGSGGFVFDDFRTCSKCHSNTPHHVTAKAVAKDCVACHGNFIDNPLDGHYIPTYPASSVTPMPVGRSVLAPDGGLEIVQGCAACHQADPTAIDPKTNTVRPIYANNDTHHGTGITNCVLCHDTDGGVSSMRRCEACHGVKSLHNIQKKSSDTATITPGAEALGYGHIGNNWDCQGCHWSWYGNASSNPATAIVPALNGQSSYTLTAGKTTTLALTGASFTNVDGNGGAYNPTVTISNATTSISLIPSLFTESEIQVTVPALQAGIYNLQVAKQGVVSNLAKLTVISELAIKTVVASKGTATIAGTGFGSAPPADYNSGLGVFVGDTQVKIVSWSNTKIVAASNKLSNGAMVTVKTLNGAISKAVTLATKKTR